MSSTWGNNIKISVFGESHSDAIGVSIDGLEAGIDLNMDEIAFEMFRRAPGNNEISTSRKETDVPDIVSGFFNGKTTGTPLCAFIKNSNTRSQDYEKTKNLIRPGHADFTGFVRYNGFNDYRGGGHFSGRLTAPIVFAGAVCKQILEKKGIKIGSHIAQIFDVCDKQFNFTDIDVNTLDNLKTNTLPFLDKSKKDAAKNRILSAKENLDSVGGIIECAVVGLYSGIGNPMFDSVESVLSHLLFSIPAVKGVEFGSGFSFATMLGSQANDSFRYDGENIKTETNNNGGINGGITNGMPIIFRTVIKPTPSIAKKQQTIDIYNKCNAEIEIQGRHDPCIVQRAVPVVEAVAAIAVYDLLKGADR